MPKKNDLADFEKIILEKVKDTFDSRFSNKSLEKKARRIGLILVAQTKQNIKNAALIDTGRLLNSINYKARQTNKGAELQYGSYSVAYAAVHEFGFHGIVPIPSHKRTSSKGKVYNVRAHNRKMSIDEVISGNREGYIRPSLVQRRKQIINILNGVV